MTGASAVPVFVSVVSVGGAVSVAVVVLAVPVFVAVVAWVVSGPFAEGNALAALGAMSALLLPASPGAAAGELIPAFALGDGMIWPGPGMG